MGIIIDTSIFIQAERSRKSIPLLFSGLEANEEAYISVATVSELLVGVHRANTEERRILRSAYVEKILASFVAIEITPAIARIQASITADLLSRGQIIGVQDIWIAATTVHNGFSLLTYDVSDFNRIAGLKVINQKQI